jgi:AMP-polyphosphate phosphotransferase
LSSRLAGVEHRKAPDNHRDREIALQFRLYQLQVAYHRQGLSAIILLEGWDAAGKGGLIKRLTAELDPRFVAVVPIAAPNAVERAQHYMARFWSTLPPKGNWTVFDRSWYGRVLVERVEGFASKAEWGRAYAEINAMEQAQVASGTRIIKLFLHTSQAEQDERLIDRLEQPWKRWKVGPDDFRNRSKRKAYLEAYEDMFAQCDTPHARWHLIGANHKQQARLEGLHIIADALAKGVDLSDPPLDADLRALAERELGVTLNPK